ncbi:hypothetical protein M409DRAFT_57520 [Zasmidium cellare ATCC 36951]|uniref:ADP-ribosylhydrolase ARH3 n=1 Tax=Zasmidium cellare ATCC 36951 TaxID=1080233 RepID=A0A6A6CCN8_ZASCE|nr:uncharacterized protein M409DRAFT_57520 [Zasmidium cellare ATCC 36951]KAF2163216.1 hypothetical protein M409DRAFT_57520 [Zasmidium cellare ATCC 36951]
MTGLSNQPSPLPADHLERVYAAVLGKVIGVYLGRPFEGWPREKIEADLGRVRYYVHSKTAADSGRFDELVITDDDVSATFMAVRALEEHGAKELTAEEIGKTWLNNVVEKRSVFAWSGNGVTTEHTAFVNLKKGIPAPESGSIARNGKHIAESIGGQIFMDAFAMCAPGNPDLAVKLAKAAASVSHDGEGVYGAMMWGAMEAEAVLSKDVDHLLDTGLRYIPSDSVVAESTQEIREWARKDDDWLVTRQRIEDKYGPGTTNKHGDPMPFVVPNHDLKILALVYGGHSFHEGLSMCVSAGWDTDSNGGNMGALLGIMYGLDGFNDGPDWRGPLADRMLISTADGGYSMNNCARVAFDLTNQGRKLAGEVPLKAPKDGAQFHFTLPGSVQGFRAFPPSLTPDLVRLRQGSGAHSPALAISLSGFTVANEDIEVLADTFMPKYDLEPTYYDLQASPLIHPGQTLTARLNAAKDMPLKDVKVAFRLKSYSESDALFTLDGPRCDFGDDGVCKLTFTIPDAFDRQPIKEMGIVLSILASKPITGTVRLDYIRWTGSPKMVLGKPSKTSYFRWSATEPWRRAWVNNMTTFPEYMPLFLVAQDVGEGSLMYGCRDWYNYKATAKHMVNNKPGPNGLAARVQGLNRWYAVMLRPGGIAIVKAFDEKRIDLATADFDWRVVLPYDLGLEVQGEKLKGYVNGKLVLEASDSQYESGGIGLTVNDGSIMVNEVEIGPAGE